MTDDYFRYYLSHVKAKKVTCRPFSNMKIKTVLHPYHKKNLLHSAAKSQLHDILEQGTNTKYEPNADTVLMNDTTLINV